MHAHETPSDGPNPYRSAYVDRILSDIAAGKDVPERGDPFVGATTPKSGAKRLPRGGPCETCREPVPEESLSARFCPPCLLARQRSQNFYGRRARMGEAS